MPTLSALLRHGALLLALAVPALPAAHAADLQVILVRHAEKASDDARDPSLSAAGQARAAALASALADAGISVVYATQFKRTQQTAAPTAATAGVDVTVRDAGSDVAADAATFAAHLRQHHRGDTVLVVGHSNTVPPLANALLGRSAVAPITDDEYDRLLLISVPDAGHARVVHARQPAIAATPMP